MKKTIYDGDYILVDRIENPDQPGCYTIGGKLDENGFGVNIVTSLNFQNGRVSENGVNGVTIESLLAIALDKLKVHEDGDCPSFHNRFAIKAIDEAMTALYARRLERKARGVEGKRRP